MILRYDKTHGSDDEGSEDVRGVPCKLFATGPDKAGDQGSDGGSGQYGTWLMQSADPAGGAYAVEGMKVRLPILCGSLGNQSAALNGAPRRVRGTY